MWWWWKVYLTFIHVYVNDVHSPWVVTRYIYVKGWLHSPCSDVRVGCYRRLNTVSPPALRAFITHEDHSDVYVCWLIFPSALKAVQISKNINSTNISKLSAWHSLSYGGGKLGILWACESYHGWKSLRNMKDTCLDVRGLLPIWGCGLVLGWVKF